MVLNNPKPYDIITDSDSEDDPWEMVGDEDMSLLVPRIDATATPDGADTTENGAVERESHQLETDALQSNIEQVGGGSFISGVSSITGDHHTVSDVEEGEDDVNNEEGVNALLEEEQGVIPDENKTEYRNSGDKKSERSDLGDSLSNEGIDREAPGAADSAADSPNEMDGEESESSNLVETLVNMGFHKEQVEKAVEALHKAGATEIDEDAVIGAMLRETNDLLRTWDFLESTARGLFDERHELRRQARDCARDVGLSARDLWSGVRDGSERLRADLRANRADADDRARAAAARARGAASAARDSVCRASGEYGVAEKLATAAAVGGATLIALGSPRAGAGAIAVAGATLAAGEAMKNASARSTSTYTRDYGLGEGLHID